jgi:CHAT domain-containing protein/tetratricopeptide (TPR) repeat protein
MAIKKTRLVLALLAVLSVNGVMAEKVNDATSQRAKVLLENPEQAKTLEDAKLLIYIAVELYKNKLYDQAEPLFQRVLAITEKSLGKDHLDVATSLNNLALFYKDQGKYDQAEPLYQRSLTIYEKSLGKDHPNVAAVLSNLAELYLLQRKYELAEPLYQRSLKIREKVSGKNHLDITGNLDNLARIYRFQDKYDKAESLYQRSLAIREKTLGKQHSLVAGSLNELASLYEAQGKYNQVEPLYQRSLAIREKTLGKDHPDVANSLNNLGMFYSNTQSKYGQAEPLLQRSLAINEKTFGKDHPNVARSLNNLAQVYQFQGRYELAEPLFQRSLAIREKAKEHSDVAGSLNNLAQLYTEQGKYEQAEPLYQRSLAIIEKNLSKKHFLVAMSLNNLAQNYFYQNKYEQAESLYQRSLAIIEKNLSKNHRLIAMVLNNLAQNYAYQKKYEQAEPLYQRSLAIYKKDLKEEDHFFAFILANLAILYLDQNNVDLAKPLFAKSLRIMNQVLDRWLWSAGEQTRQAYVQRIKHERDIQLSFYTLANTPEEALYFSLSRKNLLLRIASEASSLAKQSHDPSVKKQKQQLDALRTQLATFAFSGKADKTKIEALEEQANQLEMQLSQKVAGFKRSKTDVTPKDVFSKLTDKQALIDFLVYTEVDFKNQKLKTEQVIALLADNKDVRLMKLGELAPISKAIKSYQANIVLNDASNKQREQQLQHSAKTLYQQLWQPLAEYLKNKTTVYVVPDGELNLLPFKALQNDQGQYLSYQQQLIMLSSARDLVLPPLTAKTQATAIFADPDYGGQTNATVNTAAVNLKDIYFSPLPNTLIEAKQLQQRLQQQKIPAKLFTEKNATEQAVKNLSSPKILHLATHGFFLEQLQPDKKTLEQNLTHTVLHVPQAYSENPLTRSGLALVNANLSTQDNTKNDGILTALEVLNLKLEGTDLVTLSACETSRGDIKIGEGVYSLNRAFQEAGAKAVLSTLWEINDGATVEFMQKFYRRFLTEQSAQQALQETQQEFMQYDKFKDPFYWAGFVVFGTK